MNRRAFLTLTGVAPVAQAEPQSYAGHSDRQQVAQFDAEVTSMVLIPGGVLVGLKDGSVHKLLLHS